LQEGEILRYGLIIHEGRPQAYRERRYKMSSVKEILKSKGTQYWSISPKATAYEALQLMADKDIGAILVMEHDKVVGIFSERDYARKVILKGKSSKETMVGELMTSPVVAVTPADTLDRCMALMTVYKHRHLAVLDNGRVTGVISIGDVVNAVIITQKITIRDLGRTPKLRHRRGVHRYPRGPLVGFPAGWEKESFLPPLLQISSPISWRVPTLRHPVLERVWQDKLHVVHYPFFPYSDPQLPTAFSVKIQVRNDIESIALVHNDRCVRRLLAGDEIL
jgi:predicted transcriptional regulator